MSVTVVAQIRPLPVHRETVKKALLDTVPAVHREKGSQLYALHETTDSFIMIEKWDTAEDLAAHGAGAALDDLNRRLKGLLVGQPDVKVATAIPAGDPAKGAL